MKQKTLVYFTVAAVAAFSAAVASRMSRSAPEVQSTSGAKLFPDLFARVNDVAKVEVETKEGKFTLEQQGESWGMADKGGYPVSFDKVKELVIGIADMAIVQQKTAKPEYYADLEVQDVTAEGATSKLVKLYDKSGAELAGVVIGKPRTTKAFGGQHALFVRKAGESQAYEVTGRLWIDENSANWLDKQLAKLEKTRVRSVDTLHADGTTFAVKKNVPEDKTFTITDLPEGAELKYTGVADSAAAALDMLNFEDVQAAANVDLAGVTPTETVFTTWDGMVVRAKLYEKDGKSYLVLAAAFDPALRYEAPTPVGPETPPAAPAAEGEASPVAVTAPEGAVRPIEDVQKEVESLNAKLSPWVFTIPGYGAANFKKTIKDMLKAPAPLDDATLSAEDDPLGLGLGAPEGAVPVHDHAEHAGQEHGEVPPSEPAPTPPAEPEPPPQDGGGGR